MLGLLFLLGGSMSDLAIPMFIGMVIDKVNKDDYDAVGELCLYMIIVVVVSILVSCVIKQLLVSYIYFYSGTNL